jgi:crossover junction endodeoxyribonuclease RuvC
MRVLGIDPSTQSTGFGVIQYAESRYNVVDYGTIKPARRSPLNQKLLAVKTGIDGLIGKYGPDEIAIENPFYAQNIKTAITLGQVRGAVLVAIAGHALPLYEYSPLEIKKAVTGYGQAEKEQVSLMIRTLLKIEDDRLEEDASDALACAFCHLNTRLFEKLVAK